MMDSDIESLTIDELRSEVAKLRAAIRRDHAATGHNLCWYRPELWNLVPDLKHKNPAISVPAFPEFIHCCALFRASLDEIKPAPAKRSMACPECGGALSPEQVKCQFCQHKLA